MIIREYVPIAILKKCKDPAYQALLDAYKTNVGYKHAIEIVDNICRNGWCLYQREMGWAIPGVNELLKRFHELDYTQPFDKNYFVKAGNVITFYQPNDPYGCFCQWYARPFTVEGITYQTAEQYMMARKAALFEDYDILKKIMHTKDPATCKKLGRQVHHFNAEKWNECREDIVYRANLEKFRQNTDLRYVLLGTGEATLAEASPTDHIWGIGLASGDPRVQKPSEWKGDNLLGKALMSVRYELRLQEQELKMADLGVHAAVDFMPDNYYVSQEQRDAMEEYLKMTLGVHRWLGDEVLIKPEVTAESLHKQRIDFCNRYIPLLEMIEEEPTLLESCSTFSIYGNKKTDKIIDVIYDLFAEDAYKTEMVIYNYREVVESANLEKIANEPSEDNLKGLTEEQILGCIAWHFRADHFNNGSLINYSIAKGHMLTMLKAYVAK